MIVPALPKRCRATALQGGARRERIPLAITVLIFVLASIAHGQQTPTKTEARDIAAELLQAIELPLNVHDAALSKTDKGYVLKCRVSSNSDVQILGLRYTLTEIEPAGGAHLITNRIEGFELAAYGAKSLTFPTPIRFKPRDGSRIVLMLEQVVGAYSIWEVIKAKDALEAYVKGDYSIQPRVMRVANQVDAPLQTRVIY